MHHPLEEAIAGTGDKVEAVVAAVADAGKEAHATKPVGEFGVLLAAIRANQQNAAACDRYQLPNVGNVRHDVRPSDGVRIFLLQIARSLADSRHKPSRNAVYPDNYRRWSARSDSAAALPLIAAKAGYSGAPGVAGNVLFHGGKFERERAARVEHDTLVDAAFGLTHRYLRCSKNGLGDVGKDAIERGGIDDAGDQTGMRAPPRR